MLALLGILITGAVGWTAWARIVPPRPVVAVAVFDNETGRPEFDRLAATASDIVVERLTALGIQRVGVIGNTPTLRVPRDRTQSRGRAAGNPSRLLRHRAGPA